MNEVEADLPPPVAVAVAGPVHVGVFTNWATIVSELATTELRPVHPPTVTVNSTVDCRANPVAVSDTDVGLDAVSVSCGSPGAASALGVPSRSSAATDAAVVRMRRR